GMAVGASHTAVVGGGNVASAEAAVANVSFTGNATFFGTTTITADFVMSRAEALCAATGVSIGGVVQVTGLVINGQVVTVTGAANQFVFLSDGGYVIINEQTAGFGSITVNAVHVVDMFAGVNVVFASSTSGINCASATRASRAATTYSKFSCPTATSPVAIWAAAGPVEATSSSTTATNKPPTQGNW